MFFQRNRETVDYYFVLPLQMLRTTRYVATHILLQESFNYSRAIPVCLSVCLSVCLGASLNQDYERSCRRLSI